MKKMKSLSRRGQDYEVFVTYADGTEENLGDLCRCEFQKLQKKLERDLPKPVAVKDFKAPKIYVTSDDLGMKGVVNPLDGKKYDSKSRYYQKVKESGCEIAGNDAAFGKAKPKELSSEDRKRDIARAVYSN